MPPNETARRNHDELFPGRVSTLARTDPELIEYFDNFAFDEVLRHGDLDSRTRLMVQLASMIASQAVTEYRGCEPQVAGHVAANRNVGNGRDRLLDVLTQLIPFIGYPPARSTRCGSSTRSPRPGRTSRDHGRAQRRPGRPLRDPGRAGRVHRLPG